MVGVAGRSLHLAAQQQGVLVRDEELAIVGDGRPTAALHQRVMQRGPLGGAFLAEPLDFGGGNPAPIILFQRGDALIGAERLAAQVEPAAGQTSQRHADHSTQDALLEAIARLPGNAGLGLHPACAPPPHVGRLQILPGKRLPGLEQFEHALRQLHPADPGFVQARPGEHIGRPAALADAGIAVAHEMRFAAAPGFAEGLGAPGTEFAALEIPP